MIGLKQRLEQRNALRPSTLLGLGPMSRSCVDAAIDAANQYDVPVMLIASRRQVDAAALGGGYVEGWTTEGFAEYVRNRDTGGKVLLCRDHGGPWQGTGDPMDPAEAMARAKLSYKADIEAGFSVIHIDPSIDPQLGRPPFELVLDRMFELYRYCWDLARAQGRDIVFEVGTEEQTDVATAAAEAGRTLAELSAFCKSEGAPMPLFVVLQIGTKVVEDRNIGCFPIPFRVGGDLPAEIQIPMAVDLLARHGVFLKVHNSDYLNDEALSWMPRLGIQAANIAPEFGILESRKWLALLQENGLQDLAQRFVELADASGKWKKWLAPGSHAGPLERATLAGHYIFNSTEFRALKADADIRLRARGIDIDKILHDTHLKAIERYFRLFRLIG